MFTSPSIYLSELKAGTRQQRRVRAEWAGGGFREQPSTSRNRIKIKG